MKQLLLLFVLLLFPSWVDAQESFPVRKKPTTSQIATAEETIKQAKADPVVMPYGGWALVPLEVPSDPYVVPGGDECLNQQIIPKGKAYEGWMVSKNSPGFQFIKVPADEKLDRILVQGIKEGTSTIIWMSVDGGKAVVVDAKVFVVGKPKPVPPTPDPEPTPTPTPIPGEGLRVLFVYETKDLSTLPSAQVQSLTAREVLDYLDSHCLKVDGQPEYRKLDPNTDMSKASEIWQTAMKRPRTSLPFLLISNGKTGYEGPLPANTAELMKLLKQYGGN